MLGQPLITSCLTDSCGWLNIWTEGLEGQCWALEGQAVLASCVIGCKVGAKTGMYWRHLENQLGLWQKLLVRPG